MCRRWDARASQMQALRFLKSFPSGTEGVDAARFGTGIKQCAPIQMAVPADARVEQSSTAFPKVRLKSNFPYSHSLDDRCVRGAVILQ